jgi:hypothetical protein
MGSELVIEEEEEMEGAGEGEGEGELEEATWAEEEEFGREEDVEGLKGRAVLGRVAL